MPEIKEKILNLVDLDKDKQVSKLDVIRLQELIWDKESFEKFEESLNLSEVKKLALDSLEASLKSFFEQTDFLPNIQKPENIYLIQFYAKNIFWMNIELNWIYSGEIKDIYEKVVYNLNNFEDKAFWKYLFDILISKNTHFDQKLISREDFENIKPDILVKNEKNRLDITLPNDLKIEDLLFVMKKVNNYTFGESLPANASFQEFSLKLKSYIFFLKSQNFVDNSLLDKLEKSCKDIWIDLSDESGIEKGIFEKNLSKYNIQGNLDENLKLKFLEDMICDDLKNYFQTSISEENKRLSKKELKVPTKKDWEKVLNMSEEEKKQKSINEIEDKEIIEAKMKVMSNEEILLRDAIWFNKMKKQLDEVRKTKDPQKIFEVEKLVCNKIIFEIAKYLWADQENSDSYELFKIQKTKIANCLGRSWISESIFEDLNIKNSHLNIWGHSAMMVYLSDWQQYYFDPTNATEIWTFEDLKLVEWWKWIYWKGKITLKNSFEKSWMRELWSNWAITDKDWYINFSYSDWEKWIFWARLTNYSNSVDIDKRKEFIQNSQNLNPNDVDSLNNLWNYYTDIWNYENAVNIFEKSLILSPKNKIALQNLSATYDKMWLNEYNLWNYEQAKKYYKKSITYFPNNVDSLIELWYLYLKEENNTTSFEYFKNSITAFMFLLDNWIIEKNNREQMKDLAINMERSFKLNNTDVLLKLGLAFRLWKDFSKARKYINLAIKKDPENWEGYYELWILNIDEKKDKASFDQFLFNMNEALKILNKDSNKNSKDIKNIEKTIESIKGLLGKKIKL